MSKSFALKRHQQGIILIAVLGLIVVSTSMWLQLATYQTIAHQHNVDRMQGLQLRWLSESAISQVALYLDQLFIEQEENAQVIEIKLKELSIVLPSNIGHKLAMQDTHNSLQARQEWQITQTLFWRSKPHWQYQWTWLYLLPLELEKEKPTEVAT